MPKFPRFTSGTFGRLDFATMNDLFDRVEQLEVALGVRSGNRRQQETELVIAQPTQLMSTSGSIQTWRWKEVIVDESYSIVDEGTRSSTGPSSSDEYPLVGKGLTQDQPCLAKAMYDETGKLFYRAIDEAAKSDVICGIIVQNSPGGTGGWVYTLEQVELQLNGQFTAVSPTFQFSARNSCEYVGDAPPTGPFGVGAIIPENITTMQRQPIRTGVIAICLRMPAGTYAFSIPNGYRVVC